MSPRRTFVIVALVTFGLDQLTKALARAWLVEGRVAPFFAGVWDWRLSFNKGVAFSMGWGTTPWLLAGFALAAATVAALWAWRSRSALEAAAAGLVAAGAVGNGLDRVVHGKVTDFIFWHAGTHRWPAFNIADVGLVGGALLFVLASLLAERAARRAARG